jgi:hypothetical protein
MLDEKLMGVLEAIYWSDSRLTSGELNALGAGDLKKALAIDSPSQASSGGSSWFGSKPSNPIPKDAPTQRELKDVELYWKHKLDAASSLLTKSGVGRDSTTLVAEGLNSLIDSIVNTEPMNHHPVNSERIVNLSRAILRQYLSLTSDQVENSIKPFKHDVDVDLREWSIGQEKSVALFEKEITMLEERVAEIKNRIGSGRKLRTLMEYSRARDKREEHRKREVMRSGGKMEDVEEPIDYRYSPAQVLEGALVFLSYESIVDLCLL